MQYFQVEVTDSNGKPERLFVQAVNAMAAGEVVLKQYGGEITGIESRNIYTGIVIENIKGE